MIYKVSDNVKIGNIKLGKVGENNVVKIVFDVSLWKEIYGAGSCSVVYSPPKRLDYYPVNTKMVGDTVEWTVTNSDTAKNGKGKIELRYYTSDGLKKSETIDVTVEESPFYTEGTAPDPVNDWIEDAERTLGDVKIALEDIPNTIHGAIGNEVGGLREEISRQSESILDIKTLLQQVRDALQNGDIDEAINLLDSFLLDEGVLE